LLLIRFSINKSWLFEKEVFMNIALALSGGGFRATVFHLGVLTRLAEENQLENVGYLSTVSGGSLCAGLVFKANDFIWPTSQQFKQKVLPAIYKTLTEVSLKDALIKRSLLRFFELGDTRADDISILMRQLWGIDIDVKDLPKTPHWMINATCFESGKNWRFERFRMGDYQFGYTYDTDVPLSDAMAASAGFPGLIGALPLETSGKSWFRYLDGSESTQVEDGDTAAHRKTRKIQPPYSPVHLWDGGVYDNHGLEGLHDFVTGWKPGVDFLLVSDAAGRSKPTQYRSGINSLERIITGVLMDQVRSLRARAILERIINHGDKGAFLQTGNTSEHILTQAGKGGEAAVKAKGTLKQAEAEQVAYMETDIEIDKPTFKRVFQHGFEVADATFYGYNSPTFKFVGYKKPAYFA
jgi:NTE family protein